MNAVKTITVQGYKCTKILMWMEVHIYNVKATSQAGNIWVKHILTTQNHQHRKKIS